MIMKNLYIVVQLMSHCVLFIVVKCSSCVDCGDDMLLLQSRAV